MLEIGSGKYQLLSTFQFVSFHDKNLCSFFLTRAAPLHLALPLLVMGQTMDLRAPQLAEGLEEELEVELLVVKMQMMLVL